MEKFWMMVLAVIVAVLLMNLVVNPLMNMFSVKEGLVVHNNSGSFVPWGSPPGPGVNEGPANTYTNSRWNPVTQQMEYNN